MEPENTTMRLLQELRDEVRRASDKTEVRFEKMDQRFETMDQHLEKMDQHFKVLETSLRDFARQMRMVALGVDTAL